MTCGKLAQDRLFGILMITNAAKLSEDSALTSLFLISILKNMASETERKTAREKRDWKNYIMDQQSHLMGP